MANGFRYKTADVIPDIRDYLWSLASEDVYGALTIRTSLHLVDELVSDVSVALYDAPLRNELLDRRLPDTARILLEGVGLLPDDEILRRWDMLRDIYGNFAATEAAAVDLPAGCMASLYAGAPEDYGGY